MIKHALLTLILSTGAGTTRCEFSTHATDGPQTAGVSAATATAQVGSPAPAFSLADETGKQVALADLAGKVVVLEWVNPDCPFVRRHYDAGTMSTLASKYRDAGVVWLAVNTTKYMGGEDNRKWIAAHSLPYRILDDHAGQVGRLYGAKTTPHMFVIDPKGTLVYAGAIDDDPQGSKSQKVNYVEQALAEVLAGKAVTVGQTKPYGCSVKFAD
jgi:peroxiredoxin